MADPTEFEYGLDLPVYNEVTGLIDDVHVDSVEINGRRYPTRRGIEAAFLVRNAVTTEVITEDVATLPCGLMVNRGAFEVCITGEDEVDDYEIKLNRVEFNFLAGLVFEPRRAHEKQGLLKKAAGGEFYAGKYTDVVMAALRRAFWAMVENKDYPDLSNNYGLFETVRGLGFKMGKRAFEPRRLWTPSEPLLTEK